LGAVIAASILVATERSAALIVIMFVLAMLTFSLMSLNYGLGVVFLTPMVIVLISTGQPEDWGLAGHRMLNTLIGAGLALLGGYLLWPKVDRRELVDELVTALEADRVYLRAVMCKRRSNWTARAGRKRQRGGSRLAVGLSFVHGLGTGSARRRYCAEPVV
jgi:uncharacterized membrane protein YccC